MTRLPSAFAAGAGCGVASVLLVLAVLLPPRAVAEEPAETLSNPNAYIPPPAVAVK